MKKLKPRSRRKQPPFKPALLAAKQTLLSKRSRRASLLEELQELNRDIPNLERTVTALEQQLRGSGATGADAPLTSQGVSRKVGEVAPDLRKSPFNLDMREIPISEIPPEIRAQLPPEDLSNFGSHYEGAEDDTLPEITGKPVIPEKA